VIVPVATVAIAVIAVTVAAATEAVASIRADSEAVATAGEATPGASVETTPRLCQTSDAQPQERNKELTHIRLSAISIPPPRRA
jgi:hypothetical protein